MDEAIKTMDKIASTQTLSDVGKRRTNAAHELEPGRVEDREAALLCYHRHKKTGRRMTVLVEKRKPDWTDGQSEHNLQRHVTSGLVIGRDEDTVYDFLGWIRIYIFHRIQIRCFNS